MNSKRSVKFYANATRAWNVAAQGESISPLLISPYITSTIARTIGRRHVASIYTLFDAELFARGASSLSTLEALIKDGHSVYFLPDVHAKVMLFGNQIATVGSQNLTRRGTKNKELTAAFNDNQEILKIRSLTDSWLTLAEPITLAMILAMKQKLPPIRRAFKKIDQAASFLTENILADARTLRTRTQVAATFEQHQRAIRRIQNSLAHTQRPAERIFARVHQFSDGTTSLLRLFAQDSFTSWSFPNQTVNLHRITRYLCLLEKNGAIGWARVGESRISFINDRLRIQLEFEEKNYEILFLADWNEKRLFARNLAIEVFDESGVKFCELHCSFEVNKLRLLEITSEPNSRFSKIISNFRKKFPDLSQVLLKQMLQPFDYKLALSGKRPLEFVGAVGQCISVELVKMANYNFLVLREVQ